MNTLWNIVPTFEEWLEHFRAYPREEQTLELFNAVCREDMDDAMYEKLYKTLRENNG